MSESAEERGRYIELLNQTHAFPTRVVIKVIGVNRVTLLTEVVTCVRSEMSFEDPPEYTTREARGGRHIAITIEPMLEHAEQVLAIYDRLRKLEGIVMLM
ncbi:MAG: YbeD family protein [Planctomycetota bacterium]